MKKNAFTLIELLAVIVIFGIISTIAVVSYNGYIDSSRMKAYEDAEKTMEGAAKSLLTFCMTDELPNNQCEVVPSTGTAIIITLDRLTGNGFMREVKDQKMGGVCTGAVRISNPGSASDNYNLEYDVCLKCSNYSSESCWY